MNKKVVLGVVLAVPVYVAVSWGLGRAAHAQFDAFEQKWNAQPMAFVTIAERSSTSGIFSSEERLTFELNPKLSGAVSAPHARDEGASSDEVGDTRFTVVNKIQHGPLPGLRSFGLARIETTLELSEETRAGIAEMIGDKEPLLVTTVLGITGAGTSRVTSPAFEADLDGAKVSWQGIEGKLAYDRDFDRLDCNVVAPGMEVAGGPAMQMQMRELSFDCDLERAFGNLYIGTAGLKVASVSQTGPDPATSMAFENLAYAADIRRDGDYMDVGANFGVGRFALGELTMTDLRYELSFNHVHGPTYSVMQRKLEEASATLAAQDQGPPRAFVAVLGEFLPQLLEHSPQLVINRIGFAMPEGEAGLTGTLQLDNFRKEDLEGGSFFALLGKLDATADVWMSEGLLARDWTQNASAQTSDGPSAAEKLALMRMQVAQLEQQGFLKRNGDRLESHIEFKSGLLTANGLPLGGPMGGAPVPEEDLRY